MNEFWYDIFEARTSSCILDHVNPYHPLFNPVEYYRWLDHYQGLNFQQAKPIW